MSRRFCGLKNFDILISLKNKAAWIEKMMPNRKPETERLAYKMRLDDLRKQIAEIEAERNK